VDFGRIAIVNRGEPAVRLINAVRELNQERQTNIRTIALYTEPDRHAMFVREADERVALGRAFFIDPRDGRERSTYLDYALLADVLRRAGADAVWVGWGFVAEHAAFAEMCREMEIRFIGPSPEVMRKLGDKITSKLIAESADVPVAPWSGGPVPTVDDALREAERLGFPVMVKATAGGGGRGIRRVLEPAGLEPAFLSARSEALKAFGNETVFLEALLRGARHIEVQVIGDHHGTVWALGVRDCSVQRRNQKILEEAPSPALTPAQDHEVREAAARLARTAGYTNAGTVEFLFDPESGRFSFMEVNARLQVEHPITEVTTGVDIVKLQLAVAAGEPLAGEPPPTIGHAVEARLNAEDPDRDFAPAPGKLEVLRFPSGPGLRIDSGVEAGDTIPAEFDSMIAKVIAHGRDRREALARLHRALSQASVVVRDGTSNRAFLQHLVSRPEYRAGEFDIGWVDRLVAAGSHRALASTEVALCEAAIRAYEANAAYERVQFFVTAFRGRPQVRSEIGQVVELRHGGHSYSFRVFRLGLSTFRLEVDGQRFEVEVERASDAERRLITGGRAHRVVSTDQGSFYLVEADGVPHRVSRDDGGVVRAPAPSVVVEILAEEGAEVAVGDRLAVVEAMKMEATIRADSPGRVREVLVRPNQQVGAGEPLLVIDLAQAEVAVTEHRPDFSRLGAGRQDELDHTSCRHLLREMRRMVLGFDVAPREIATLMAGRGLPCPETPSEAGERRALEDEVLSAFVDVIALFRRSPAEGEAAEEWERRSSEEYLFTYLRNTKGEGRGLPERFLGQLRRALGHYGIDSLEPGLDLDRALFRIAKSHQRMEKLTAPVVALLERRLEQAGEHHDEAWRALLDRTVDESRHRYTAVHDLAVEIRHRTFDLPFLEQVRDRTYREVTAHLEALAAEPDGAGRDTHITALVECPQPLKTMLSGWFLASSPALRRALLEVMTRRYYRIRPIERVHTLELEETQFATTDYALEGRTVHVIACHVEQTGLGEAARRAARLAAAIDPGHDVVVDFYAWREAPGGNPDATRDELQELLDAHLPPGLRRVVVAISGPYSGKGMSGVEHFTFRSTPEGYREERLYRAIHPMMAKRLELWRLANFDIERLPSVEDVYIYRGVARANPRDERLFVLAEVRDLTPVRSASGKVLGIPEFERMYLEALNSIRRIQSHRPADRRLQWNRVLLYVWVPIDLSTEDLSELVRRLAPATEGLGLEKVAVHGLIPADGELRRGVIEISNPEGEAVMVRMLPPRDAPLEPLTEYTQKVVQLRRRGLMYPYELLKLLAPAEADAPPGSSHGFFVEHDLADGRLVPVARPAGENRANVVVGVVTNVTDRYPEGMSRVVLAGDPSRGMGALAEPECSRIMAAMDLAEEMRVPLEWFAVSGGALIAMDSGTENMDWIGRVLRRIIEYTQGGGELNVVVAGINVGAQPYWNAEATMLMHTRGILVMTPESAMVLTGKQALDYSGGVSAEDNQGIGGYERIMGPNGQAQYFARDLADACSVLLRHYDHTYVAPGERFPRPAPTADPRHRVAGDSRHGGEFATVGEVFAEQTNPGRKLPFEIRKVMAAAVDQDHPTLERWFGMEDAEVAVVWDAHLGGYPVCLLGLESKPLPRLGFVPADGPDNWTSGTLFPLSSKKVARAINGASGNRPLVVLANLSGFDGSPESMRRLQLEYGAEIGRAVVNFRGPIVFLVVSRYHGGAFVVFSATLNENMEVAALEGSHASVIGGAPAAAVVFSREVDRRTQEDPRVADVRRELAEAEGAAKANLRRRLDELVEEVRSEKLGEVADEFDRIHDIERARRVGSVHRIIPAAELRPYLIDAVERGMRRELDRLGLAHPSWLPPSGEGVVAAR
jgi:acetyl/propionyl-CoA carboxylase alpha subunit/acetyl-CoA carboxylase carboxyltransferase component